MLPTCAEFWRVYYVGTYKHVFLAHLAYNTVSHMLTKSSATFLYPDVKEFYLKQPVLQQCTLPTVNKLCAGH
jgi:hypothetical protein